MPYLSPMNDSSDAILEDGAGGLGQISSQLLTSILAPAPLLFIRLKALGTPPDPQDTAF